MEKKTKQKVRKIEDKPNWHRIIALSTAGQYIQNQLNEELVKVESKPFKSRNLGKSKA